MTEESIEMEGCVVKLIDDTEKFFTARKMNQ